MSFAQSRDNQFCSVYQSRFQYDSALLYVPLPFLLWAAVRFGAHGATAAISAVAFPAILGVALGNGPFSEKSAEENAPSVQVFLIFLSVPLLFLAAIIEERDEAEETLRERDARIGLASESANLALWTIDFLRNESWMNDKGRELFGFALTSAFRASISGTRPSGRSEGG